MLLLGYRQYKPTKLKGKVCCCRESSYRPCIIFCHVLLYKVYYASMLTGTRRIWTCQHSLTRHKVSIPSMLGAIVGRGCTETRKMWPRITTIPHASLGCRLLDGDRKGMDFFHAITQLHSEKYTSDQTYRVGINRSSNNECKEFSPMA